MAIPILLYLSLEIESKLNFYEVMAIPILLYLSLKKEIKFLRSNGNTHIVIFVIRERTKLNFFEIMAILMLLYGSEYCTLRKNEERK